MQLPSPHTFHIPVMGLAFTIDTPAKVARFGINSVISIIEDNLVEKMRCYYYGQLGESYQPISSKDEDYRAKRITDYLNLINRIVKQQIEELRKMPFQLGLDICKYFELLPGHHVLRQKYDQMMKTTDPGERLRLEDELRKNIIPGGIDTNIMTKLDKVNYDESGNIIENGSDAITAIRGYAQSDLSNSSIILSAGMNPRLFAYMENLSAFDADVDGHFNKKIVIKVSDFRSALIQGKMLAKKGLWVSEFRIESGLNCGGHAFATDGYLLGPILEEFKARRDELVNTLSESYNQALSVKGKPVYAHVPSLKISVQGGIGSHDEDQFLKTYYNIDSTGWGTPFLLVPEATNVDDETLELLSQAGEEEVVLSKNSPLGVRFFYLKGTSAEREKFARIQKGSPGSPCTEKYLVSNTEFTTEPICTASQAYQKKKIEHLKSLSLSEADLKRQMEDVLTKECLCIGLSNAVVKKNKLKPFKKLESVNVCPGPNIAYFSEIVSLQRMIDHIYGRINIIRATNRPHMFIKELTLYVNFWNELLQETQDVLDHKKEQYIQNFHKNLISGIQYYRTLSDQFSAGINSLKIQLDDSLNELELKLNGMLSDFTNRPVIVTP